MLVVRTIKQLQEELNQRRQASQSIALVPTMGNLHEGHLQLVKTAQQQADIVVVTLFVNPTQFGANEDLDNYPRTFQDDCNQLESINANILFAPSINEIYPLGGNNTSHVHVPGITHLLCGASRPGHFDGVTTIVCKLFNITRADVAIFGEKDYQQLAVIRRMVSDLNIPIHIISEPIVRAHDGLAMSSRNGYLTDKERIIAPQLYQALQEVKQQLLNGETDFLALENNAKTQLSSSGFRPDYCSIYHALELKPAKKGDKELVILAAAFLGPTRLIDNITCSLP